MTKGAKEALKEIAHHYPVGIYHYGKETVLRDGHMSWGLRGMCVWECGDYENKMKTIMCMCSGSGKRIALEVGERVAPQNTRICDDNDEETRVCAWFLDGAL